MKEFVNFINHSILLYLAEVLKAFSEVEQLIGVVTQVIVAILYLIHVIQTKKHNKNKNRDEKV